MEIELKNLSFSYDKHSPALSDVTATLGPGVHLLLGANGAGKTTLLHLIDGLLRPTEGKCAINGGPTAYRLPSVLSKIFYLGAGMEMPAATIEEMVRIHACFYPTFSRVVLESNLAEFSINSRQKFTSMSMGTAQKAAVAYALALQTPILLLDEPATGLDIESKHTLQRMIARSISPESTVIISTHNFSDLLPLYDSVIILDRGRLLLNSSVDEISERMAFIVTDGHVPDGTIFSQRRVGKLHCVVRNSGNMETAIDYELLYLATKHEHKIN